MGGTEGYGEFFQRNACFSFRVVREVTGNDLFLMEVAHLYGDISKQLSYPRFPIEDYRYNSVPLALQCIPSPSVYVDGFVLYFLNIEVLLQMRRSYDTDPEASPEERHIGDNDYGLRGVIVFLCRCVAYTVSYPVFALLVFL